MHVPTPSLATRSNPHFYRKVPRHWLWIDSHYTAETAVRWKQEAARCVFRCAYAIGGGEGSSSAECWHGLLGQLNATVQRQFTPL